MFHVVTKLYAAVLVKDTAAKENSDLSEAVMTIHFPFHDIIPHTVKSINRFSMMYCKL